MRRGGLMLAELLVVALIVGLLSTAYVARISELTAGSGDATRGICEANKRNLRAARETWMVGHPDQVLPAFPQGFADLREAGLLRQVPHEPGTASLGFTYRSGAGDEIVCRVHDEGLIPPREGLFTRLMVLEVLAFVLILAAYLVWKALGGRNPHHMTPVPAAPVVAGKSRPGAFDRATRLEVRQYLAELGSLGPKRSEPVG